MWTGLKAKRETWSSEWNYFNEGNAHMIFTNNHFEKENFYQDRVLVAEKGGDGMYISENAQINGIFDKAYNEVFLKDPGFGEFLTKQKLLDVKEGETIPQFHENLMKEADPKRREDRKKASLHSESRFWLEKNLFYISPMLKETYKEKNCIVFFAEIKPKCCFDEIPTFEEISGYIDQHPNGNEIDKKCFYSKFFADCRPSERKFVYRKIVGGKHKIMKEFNTSDFYSDRPFVRSKAIKGLIKENWGNYLKILDGDMNIIQHDDILSFFRKWDPKITVKTIAEIIARSIDKNLIDYVKGLQKMYSFYADRLDTVAYKLDKTKNTITQDDAETVMKHLKKYWLNKDIVDSEKEVVQNTGQDINLTQNEKDQKATRTKEEEDRKILEVLTKIEAQVGSEMHDLVESTAFLISLTSRDSSFLIRCAVSRDNHDFDVLEEWEKGLIAEHVDELKVKFTNAEPAPQNTDEFDQEKNMVYLTHLMKKLNTGYETQKVATVDDESRDYYIKARTNLCDVSIKPWAK